MTDQEKRTLANKLARQVLKGIFDACPDKNRARGREILDMVVIELTDAQAMDDQMNQEERQHD
jgi:hypothetical protein